MDITTPIHRTDAEGLQLPLRIPGEKRGSNKNATSLQKNNKDLRIEREGSRVTLPSKTPAEIYLNKNKNAPRHKPNLHKQNSHGYTLKPYPMRMAPQTPLVWLSDTLLSHKSIVSKKEEKSKEASIMTAVKMLRVGGGGGFPAREGEN